MPTSRLSLSETQAEDEPWYVTNGRDVVGPLATDVLLRGVTEGTISNRCQVWQRPWKSWRPRDEVREIAALSRPPAPAKDPFGTGEISPYFETARLLELASSPGEARLFALDVAARAASASIALLHRLRELDGVLVTSCARGDGAGDFLGGVVRRDDPAYVAARLGVRISGHEAGGPTQATIAERLGPQGTLAGVAMFPVQNRGMLVAMLELGRTDHRFRLSDLEGAQESVDALRDYLHHREG